MSDVVVLLPGIGGSVLTRDGKALWALSPGAALRGVLSLGKNLNELTLHGDDPELDDLGDGVVATALMPDLHVLPGLGWKIDGYRRCRDRLLSDGSLVPGKNYFEFPYDWRRDNRVAARGLARRAPGWLARWREESGNPGARLVLICHSMGGLVARIYLEMFEGWRDTRTLITFGTPFSGSVNALEFLANGFRRGWGPVTVDLTDMLRSFTSVHQLLPSYRCVPGPAGRWIPVDEVDWSGSPVDPDRVRDAVELHRTVRAAVDARLAADDGAGYTVRPVVGHTQRTRWAARLDGPRVEALWLREPGEDGGDGTVPTVSAVPHEHLDDQANVAFAGQLHASLQNDDALLDHVIGVIRHTGSAPVDVFPAAEEPVTLETDDAAVGEILPIRAWVPLPRLSLVADVVPIGAGESRRLALVAAGDGWQETDVEGLAAGDYRITVSGPGVHPVTDMVSVVDLVELEHRR